MARINKEIKILKFTVDVASEDGKHITFYGKLIEETDQGWYIHPRHGRNEMHIPRDLVVGEPEEMERFEFTPLDGQSIRIRLIDDVPNDGFATGWLEAIAMGIEGDNIRCLIESSGIVSTFPLSQVVAEPSSLPQSDLMEGETVLGYVPTPGNVWMWRECTINRVKAGAVSFTHSYEDNAGTHTRNFPIFRFIYRRCLWS